MFLTCSGRTALIENNLKYYPLENLGCAIICKAEVYDEICSIVEKDELLYMINPVTNCRETTFVMYGPLLSCDKPVLLNKLYGMHCTIPKIDLITTTHVMGAIRFLK